MGTWDKLLPIIQQINDYGGNFISIFICRAVVDEIDRGADSADTTLVDKRARMNKLIKEGKWPADHDSFSRLFEIYHEALFYILARRKNVGLEHIPEGKLPTADFRTTRVPVEQFEVKTINFTGGGHALASLMERGLEQKIELSEEAKRRGTAFGVREIRPHGEAANTFDAIQRVMAQIANNVKADQFSGHPTFLVVPMTRTALRNRSEELARTHYDFGLDGEVSGHLWTIAARDENTEFRDWNEWQEAHSYGKFARAGVVREFSFVRGAIFIETVWHLLPGCDRATPFPNQAFRLHGIWNANWYQGNVGYDVAPAESAFPVICDDWKSSQQ